MERDIFLKAASGSETICLEVELGLMSHCSKSVVIFIFRSDVEEVEKYTPM